MGHTDYLVGHRMALETCQNVDSFHIQVVEELLACFSYHAVSVKDEMVRRMSGMNNSRVSRMSFGNSSSPKSFSA